MVEYVGVTQAATLLGLSYSRTRDFLSEKKALDFSAGNGRARVDVARLRQLQPSIGEVPASWFQRKQEQWVPLRQIIRALPVMKDQIKTREQLKQMLSLGMWPMRILNHCERWRQKDFKDLESWATPAERRVKVVLATLPKKAGGKKALQEVKTLLIEWQGLLRERRLALLRAQGILDHDLFVKKYKETKALVLKVPWGKLQPTRDLKVEEIINVHTQA
jgi:hypothetical protein